MYQQKEDKDGSGSKEGRQERVGKPPMFGRAANSDLGSINYLGHMKNINDRNEHRELVIRPSVGDFRNAPLHQGAST